METDKGGEMRSLIYIVLLVVPGRAIGDVPEHYCGVYATYAALRAEGIAVAFESLCDQQYIGSFAGSTMDEIHRAAIDHGAYARNVVGLTPTTLKCSRHPIVLHVRHLGLHACYGHWVTFLGTDEYGNAKSFDPPNEFMSLTFAQLAALSDGVGVVVSSNPIGYGDFVLPSVYESAIPALATCLLFVIARWFGSRLRGLWNLTFVSLGVAAISIVASPESLLRNPSAVGLVMGHRVDPELQEVNYDVVKSMGATPNTIIIDCRVPEDYAIGHVPGAINLPATSRVGRYLNLLDQYDKRINIIVYCQSSQCNWSTAVGTAVYHLGFGRTCIYRGGWDEWSSHATAN